MRYIALLTIFLFLPLLVQSKVDRTIRSTDTLKVVKISPDGSTVKVGGKRIEIGNIIDMNSKPEWVDAKYLILYNLRTNVKFGFCNKDFHSCETFYSSYIKRNSTSSKGDSEDEGVKDMGRVMNNTFYMIEGEVLINLSLPNKNSCYFILRTLHNGKYIDIPLPYHPDEPYLLYISKDYLESYDLDLSLPVRFSVEYVTEDRNIPITNDMYIECVE